jgi:hypothetical protein
VPDAAILVYALLETQVFAADRNLPGNRLQQLEILAGVRFLGFLVAKHQQAEQLAIVALDRNEQADPGFLQPCAIGHGQPIRVCERQLYDPGCAERELAKRRRRTKLSAVKVTPGGIPQRERGPFGFAVPHEQTRGMERRFEFVTDELGYGRRRLQRVEIFDQPEEKTLAIIRLTKEATIEPPRQPRMESQAEKGCNDQVHVGGVRQQESAHRLLPVRQQPVGEAGGGQQE